MKLKNKSISREVATHHFYKREATGFPDRSVSKESACSAGDPGSFPGLGRSPGEGKGYPLQYSDLENSMDEEMDTTEQLTLSLSLSGLVVKWP